MKSRMFFFMVAAIAAAVMSCSDDNEVKRKGDPDIKHTGDRWIISSIEYRLTDQGVSGTSINQVIKDGTKANAGFFYFVSGGERGSFEINVEGYNKEDLFTYGNSDGSVSISQITQTVGVTTNQNIVEIGGTSSETEMTLSGVILKQSLTGQFTLTIHSLTLTKE